MMDFDVVSLGPSDHPGIGETAPDFTRPLVNDEFWEDRTLSELADGNRLVLVFTPMIGSFLAEYAWNEIRDRGWDDYEATVVGVTVATPYAVSRFLDEQELPFALFSDPSNEVAERYGVEHDLDGMAGVSEPRLSAFVLESDLTVAEAWVAREWPEFPDYDDLERTLES
ncbi:redoxin domain-containing protein [Natrialbaceae archaeon A-gly3]